MRQKALQIKNFLTIARKVNELVKQPDVNGVVITHGTDTLEETAYFLSLTVHTDKPIVVVGSMRPPSALSADGPLNLYSAVALAAADNAKAKGVFVLMNDDIFAARDVTKTINIHTNGFASQWVHWVHWSKVKPIGLEMSRNVLIMPLNSILKIFRGMHCL